MTIKIFFASHTPKKIVGIENKSPKKRIGTSLIPPIRYTETLETSIKQSIKAAVKIYVNFGKSNELKKADKTGPLIPKTPAEKPVKNPPPIAAADLVAILKCGLIKIKIT